MPHDSADHAAIVVEDDAGNIEAQIIVDALQEVLIAKGLLTAREVTATIARLESPCLLYTSPSPRDQRGSRMPSSA